MTPLPIAFSFPCWTCLGCGQVVEWEDAEIEDTPEVFTIRHRECVGDA